jgi:sugar/nucleoside kinase (ribokinase family)
VANDAFTALVLSLIDADGERVLFGWPRQGAAHVRLRPEQTDAVQVASSAWLHSSGMMLTESPASDAVLQAMTLAQAAGVPVSFDLNLRGGIASGEIRESFAESIWQAIGLADVVLGSATDEIALLVPATSPQESARVIAEAGSTVVGRLGADGAFAAAPGGKTIAAPAFPVPVANTVGAGDAFNAGFIAAGIAGEPLSVALRWGNAVAALTVSQPGAWSAPDRSAVETLLRRHPTTTGPSAHEGVFPWPKSR